MSSHEPLIEFEELVNGNDYIGAVEFLTCKLDRLIPKKPFQDRLFGEKSLIFIKALRQAIKNNNKLWARKLLSYDDKSLSDKIPDWFTKIKGEEDWCQDARSHLLKAQVNCAKQAILSTDLEANGWKDLADKTGLSAGFVYDLFHLLKEDRELNIVKQGEIPALLEKGYGADGQAAYIVIELVKLDFPSEPYPHPIKMSNIPIQLDSFQKAIVCAFEYVRQELLMSGKYTKENIPVFRWWVKPAPNEEKVLALGGPSIYGAFAVGMLSLSLARQSNISENTAITCDGDEYGHISEIGGLAQKCQAARRQGWNIIIAKAQNTELGGNDISNVTQLPLLLGVERIKEAMTYLTSEVGFEVINYLDLVHERWGKLQQQNEINKKSDDFTRDNKVRVVKGENCGTIQDWDEISKKVKQCVICGGEKVGKTRLLLHEGIKISRESALNLKGGQFDLKEVNIPIFLSCIPLALLTKEGYTFEKAIYATLKNEYRINGREPSQDFIDLIQEKFLSGHCHLLLDDFSRVDKENQSYLAHQIRAFATNYHDCRILITVHQVTENTKDGCGGQFLEISSKSDEIIVELLSSFREVRPYKGRFFVVLLIVIVLFSLGIVNYWWNWETSPPPPPPPSLSVWYSKAISAMELGKNSNALEYVNRGLEKKDNTADQVADLVALKIKLLLLAGDADIAESTADQYYDGYSLVLDDWIDCLREKKFFSSLITTETGLNTKCPSPERFFHHQL